MRRSDLPWILICGLILAITVRAVVRAFSTAWVWNLEQILVLLYAAVIGSKLISWGKTWQRSGCAGVQARWSRAVAWYRTARTRFLVTSMFLWMGVAAGLVVAFNLLRG